MIMIMDDDGDDEYEYEHYYSYSSWFEFCCCRLLVVDTYTTCKKM